ncbi:Uncharacterised protein [Bordetella pertussis]|nr:Uncharacterised protein [Bordetella pertussis]
MVVATDFSEGSRQALDRGAQQQAAEGGFACDAGHDQRAAEVVGRLADQRHGFAAAHHRRGGNGGVGQVLGQPAFGQLLVVGAQPAPHRRGQRRIGGFHDVQRHQAGLRLRGEHQGPVQRAVAARAQVGGKQNGGGLGLHAASPGSGRGLVPARGVPAGWSIHCPAKAGQAS